MKTSLLLALCCLGLLVGCNVETSERSGQELGLSEECFSELKREYSLEPAAKFVLCSRDREGIILRFYYERPPDWSGNREGVVDGMRSLWLESKHKGQIREICYQGRCLRLLVQGDRLVEAT